MNKFGFILGRESELSKAEIFRYLKKSNAYFEIILNKNNILIITTDKSDIKLDHLGGTIKLFEILGEGITRDNLKKFIQNNLELNQTEKRINFGISGYGQIQSNQIYALGKNIKDKLIDEGLKARFVTGKFKDLSSVIVKENKLIERGFELSLIENNGNFYVGQTIAVQDYKAYSKRDFGRTARDDKSGMLPPKLAQILINLGSKDIDSIIYDPFCGSGTVLQEAVLMGYKNIYGSDISEKAITDTRENLNWLLSRHSELVSESQAEWILKQVQNDVFVSDILRPTKDLRADLIVGEGFLGEPTRRNVQKAKDDAKNLGEFYLKAFTNISKMLKPNGTAVIAVPYFIIGKEKVFLKLQEKLKLTGLRQIKIDDVRMTERNTLLYSRPDSFVGREIYILEKI